MTIWPPAKEGLSPQHTAALRDLVAGYCGVYLDDTRLTTIEAAARRRAEFLRQPLPIYVATLRARRDPLELQQLAELLLNHETQFFRNRPHMDALRSEVLPALHQRLPPGLPLRIWSAGCSTGEEPYSIAIAALEALGDPPPRPIEIWATDLSESALARARAGTYRGRTLANLSAQQRTRFFERRGDGLAIGSAARRLVRFEQLNLLEPFPPQARGLHIIFCQNVTIYFQVRTCRALMERFYHALDEGGTLFLGFSETLWNIFDRFHWQEVAGTYVYVKQSERQEPLRVPPIRSGASSPRAAVRRFGTKPAAATGAEIVTRGRALLAAGDIRSALALFSEAPLADQHAPQILALAARAHADRGDLDLAAAEAHRALELNPLTTEAHMLIGLIYARQGQHTAAIQQLERARYLDGDSPVIAFHLAESYRQAGRFESALREYRSALKHLAALPPDHVIDGVASGWLTETCRRYEALLNGESRRG
ncbi:MAG: CheR family methyltransferase [Chloroflexaceae bacterium]